MTKNSKIIRVTFSRTYEYDDSILDGKSIKERVLEAKGLAWLDFADDWIYITPEEEEPYFSAKIKIYDNKAKKRKK